MAKNCIVAFLVLLLYGAAGVPVFAGCVDECYTAQIGVREATGQNDGEKVEMYLRSVGFGKGYSWCAAFVKWVFDQCGVATRITAWSPTAHNKYNPVWFQKKHYQEAEPGDVFTVYSVSKKRIVHTGFFHRQVNDNFFETVEGNTNEGGSSNGDGVYKRKRSFNATFSITRWL
jgi:hypothetical protein